MKAFAALVVLALISACVADDLKLALLLYRHGDRTPIHYLPEKWNQFSNAPRQKGQLTQIGQKQHYDLGQQYRQRYVVDNQILSPQFNNSEIMIRSTGADRTIMSAYSNLVGIYPPGQGNPDLPSEVQPLPIRSALKKPWRPQEDILLTPFRPGQCPTLDAARADLIKSPKAVAFVKTHQAWFDRMTTLMNLEEFLGEPLSLHNIDQVYDALMVMHYHNLDFTDGLTLADYTTAEEIHQFLSHLQVGEAGSYLSRQVGSNLAAEWLGEIDATLAGSPNASVIVYSAHDSTLEAVMRFYDVFPDDLAIEYAAHLELEMWTRPAGDSYVKLQYNDRDLVMKGCPHAECPVETYRAMVKPLLLDDWFASCGITPPEPEVVVKTINKGVPPAVLLATAAVLTVAMAVLVVVAFVCGLSFRIGHLDRKRQIKVEDGFDVLPEVAQDSLV